MVPGTRGGENDRSEKYTAMAMDHEIAAWRLSHARIRGHSPPTAIQALNTAMAIPRAKKSIQLVGQMSARRYHDGWTVTSRKRNTCPKPQRPRHAKRAVRVFCDTVAPRVSA